VDGRKTDTSLGYSSPVASGGPAGKVGATKNPSEPRASQGGPDSKDKSKTSGAQPAPPKKKVAVDSMLACRYEMKYLVNEIEAAGIVNYVQPFLPPDRYSKLHPGGQYPIVSLYLDSPELQLCRESYDGVKNRFKLRIRSYTDEPEYPRFFEIKRRINRVIMKSRARVTDKDVPLLLEGRSLPPQGYTTDLEALNQFQMYVAAIHAGPVVLIRYLRQAFEGTTEDRVRVTFDRELCYKVTEEPYVRLGGSGWQRNNLTTGYTILEIKFNGRYPAWLTRLVRHFNLEVRAISKYGTSVQQACRFGFCAPALRYSWNG
jgi:hypothetical protein